MLKLINTIEISPFKYSKDEYEMPELSARSEPEEWYNLWVNAISSLDLNLNAVKPGDYLVDIENIDDRNLRIILEENLKDTDDDSIVAFDGGIVVMIDGEIKITPTCCSDIGNIAEWQKIFEKETSDWSDLWIGHPWIFYKKQNGKIQFSDYSEHNLQDFKDIKSVFEVEEYELKKEFEKIKQQQINFKNKISEVLKIMNVVQAERISELMTAIK